MQKHETHLKYHLFPKMQTQTRKNRKKQAETAAKSASVRARGIPAVKRSENVEPGRLFCAVCR